MTVRLRDLGLVAAQTDEFSAAERESLAAALVAAQPLQAEAALIHTCHRVELVWAGSTAPACVAALPHDARQRLRQLRGEAVARHLLRLASGLESAVIGEDQVLSQVRAAAVAGEATLRPEVRRLLDLAIETGRRARAGQTGWRHLGNSAIAWLEERRGSLRGEPLLIVGTGTLGERLAGSAAARGARLVVAGRTVQRAERIAARHGGEAVDLDGAWVRAAAVGGIAVALSGPWTGSAGIRAGALPAIVDLSTPPALPAGLTGSLADRYLDIDGLYDWRPLRESAYAHAYAGRADQLVEAGVARYVAWLDGRAGVGALTRIRERAEERRRNGVDRLLRRLPTLDAREQELVVAFSRQLTASLLHEPTARLREDSDGTLSEAASRLFDLPA